MTGVALRSLAARAAAAASPERRRATEQVDRFAQRAGLTPRCTRHLHAFLHTQAASDRALRAIRPLTALALLEERGTTRDLELAASLRCAPATELHTRLPVPGTPTRAGRPHGVDILVASSPRAGNTILRRLISRAAGADRSVHALDDLEWTRLPSPVVVQSHVPPDAATLALVERYGVRVVTVVRDPVDTLLSAAAFAERAPETLYWPGGRPGPDPRTTGDVDGFRRWANSESAAALLAVSVQWVLHGGAMVVRYEDLVEHPQGTVDRLTLGLGLAPLADATGTMRAETADLPAAHRTHGGPGARYGLDTDTLAEIALTHRRAFEVLGYG